jgi:acetyl-CoA C-acetyltransferase
MSPTGAFKFDRPVYIVDGCRTPFLKSRGKPGPFRASDLAVAAGRALLLRQPFSPDALDEVIVGCVNPGPDEANIARIVSLRLGCGSRVPAWTLQRNCGSGMQAVDSAAANIASGRSDLVLAGGTEAMSHAPLLLDDSMVRLLAEWRETHSLWKKLALMGSLRPAHFSPVIGLLHGLTDPVTGLSMGQTAENLATLFHISRERMDGYAVQSHRRLARALDEGRLTEIVPIYKDDGRCFDRDEGLRRDTDVSNLARLKPVFDRPVGCVTAGNSAQITDGAAWVILAGETAVDRYRLPVAGRITACAWAGVAPEIMGLGPVHAMTKVLLQQGLRAEDIDCWEINEAFAAQVLACLDAWSSPDYCRESLGLKEPWSVIDEDRVNVDGGALAIGHPVGASGVRIILHLSGVMARNHMKRGMAGICIGGGQGGAMLVERY